MQDISLCVRSLLISVKIKSNDRNTLKDRKFQEWNGIQSIRFELF